MTTTEQAYRSSLARLDDPYLTARQRALVERTVAFLAAALVRQGAAVTFTVIASSEWSN